VVESVQPLDVAEGTWVLCITYFIIYLMFSGNQYYLYNGNELQRGFPKPLSNLGLPESLEKIDGAMVWGHNGKTYFFSGTMYWK
jgi:Hemopexin.